MGVFRSKEWTIPGSEARYRFAFAWGTLIDNPHKIAFKKVKTEFVLKVYRNTFVVCGVWGEGDAVDIMNQCEKGDMVLVFGVETVKRYTNKDGGSKDYTNLNVEVILPMPVVVAMMAMFTNPAINKLMEEAEDEGDAFETPEELYDAISGMEGKNGDGQQRD